MTELTTTEVITEDSDGQEIVIDAPWIASQVMAILYFIEFQFGEESTKALEQIAKEIETKMRQSETDAQ